MTTINNKNAPVSPVIEGERGDSWCLLQGTRGQALIHSYVHSFWEERKKRNQMFERFSACFLGRFTVFLNKQIVPKFFFEFCGLFIILDKIKGWTGPLTK